MKRIMEKQLTKEQIEAFTEVFSLFDKDSSGCIDTKELSMVMTSLGQKHTESEMTEILNLADANNSGKVDLDEFLHMMAFKLQENNKKEEIRETFKAFDKEDTGYINAKELKMVMTNLGLKVTNEEIQEMMKFANLDDEADQLSFEEFAQMMTKIM